MEKLWAPWRMKYIMSEQPKGCIFCVKPSEDTDKDNYILHRSKHAFVIMNIFPYNNGHLMVVPYRHLSDFEMLNTEEKAEIMDLISLSIKALKKAFNPEGFNVGMNIGRIAGAGIADHLHAHVVPRWGADTNYMPVIADTKVLSEALEDTYIRLKDLFKEQ
ncbi:MAG: HIT domain-containing protein [Actinobacteria bacterium]|nr:MAG: HIT domain-containing protein [Actinomycetota bacterium]